MFILWLMIYHAKMGITVYSYTLAVGGLYELLLSTVTLHMTLVF